MNFGEWIGKTETRGDEIAEAPLRGLAALLDRDPTSWGDHAPPLAHWLYFLPTARQSEIDVDGHPKRGGFLPPIDLPRRMWAGGRLSFHAPLPIGAAAERTSTINNVAQKDGASGPLVFVTVAHEVRVGDTLIISEQQDIVYRGATAGASPAPAAPDERVSAHTRSFTPDPVTLFRFSALTFNAHRIHYDRDYAVRAEGYPGLVVQGPYIATLLMHHALERLPASQVRGFSFRAQLPLFDGAGADLCADEQGALWCRNADGASVMKAQIDLR